MLSLKCSWLTHTPLKVLLCTQVCPPCLLLSHTSSSSSLAFCLFSLSDSDSNDGEQGKGFSVTETYCKSLCTQHQHSLLTSARLFFFFVVVFNIFVFHCNQMFSFSVLHPSFPQNVCCIKNDFWIMSYFCHSDTLQRLITASHLVLEEKCCLTH